MSYYVITLINIKKSQGSILIEKKKINFSILKIEKKSTRFSCIFLHFLGNQTPKQKLNIPILNWKINLATKSNLAKLDPNLNKHRQANLGPKLPFSF